MSSTAEVFAAMKEAVTGDGGKALQGKFKVGRPVVASTRRYGALFSHVILIMTASNLSALGVSTPQHYHRHNHHRER